MTDTAAAPAATPTAAASPAAPSHYDVLLSQAFVVPDLGVTIPGGRSVVIAAVADQIPPGIVVAKTPAVA